MQDLLYVALYTTQVLPLNLLLLTQAWHLKYSPPKSPELGAALKKTAEGWLVERVASDSMAERAGIAPQDVLIALNRFKLNQNRTSYWPIIHAMRRYPVLWRDGVLHNTTLLNRIFPRAIGAL